MNRFAVLGALVLALSIPMFIKVWGVSRGDFQWVQVAGYAGMAVGTAGSSIVFAGTTVFVALIALTLVGIPFGIALLLAAIPVLLVAYTTSAWLVGRRILRNRSASPWAALFAGWAILRLLA